MEEHEPPAPPRWQPSGREPSPPLALVTGAARRIGRRQAPGASLGQATSSCSSTPVPSQPPAGYEVPRVARTSEETAAGCRNGRGIAEGVETRVADVLEKAGLEDEIADAVGGRSVAAAVAAAGAIAGGEAQEHPRRRSAELMIGINLHGAHAASPRRRCRRCWRRGGAVSSPCPPPPALRAMPRLSASTRPRRPPSSPSCGRSAADLAGSGVTANAPSAPVRRREAMLAESARIYGLPGEEDFAPQRLVRRLLDPEEVAAVVAWLCGPESSALTGAVIAADGGLGVIGLSTQSSW